MISAAEARESVDSGEGWTLEEDTGCWLWNEPAHTGFGPYLSFYRAAYGDPPDGFQVAHMCRSARKGCVRPSHLDVVVEGSVLPNLAEPRMATELRSAFSSRIRDERESRRLSRADFARELRVSQATLADWETGRRAPSAENYRSLAKKMGWDGKSRKYAVVFVHEQVVSATSTGQALRKVWDSLEREGQQRKSYVYNVRPATK